MNTCCDHLHYCGGDKRHFHSCCGHWHGVPAEVVLSQHGRYTDVMSNTNDITNILNPVDTNLLSERVATWLATLTERSTQASGWSHAFGIDKLVRFVRVWEDNVSPEGEHSGRSVHAFLDPATGDVFKAAGWKAPAKHVRFNLLDDASFDRLIKMCDTYGSYLYLR